jgi:sugar phosphate isomerase/epimerase
MEEHAKFGCKNIGLGMMPVDVITDEVQCKKTVEALNLAGEMMQRNGFAFFYHHHHYEFFKHGKESVFDYILKNAPYISFTADTYWLQYGGVSIEDTVSRLQGRVGCVHLKDYKTHYYDEKYQPIFAPLGEGTLNFQKIVKTMKENGVKYFLIEQDNAADLPDTMQPILQSLSYAKNSL